MKIKLYVENDSRPRGSYENCLHAEVRREGILVFKTSSGKSFITTLRYCLEVEEGDKLDFTGNMTEIIGAPKPEKPANVKKSPKGAKETGDLFARTGTKDPVPGYAQEKEREW